jgi:hypothetical protein
MYCDWFGNPECHAELVSVSHLQSVYQASRLFCEVPKQVRHGGGYNVSNIPGLKQAATVFNSAGNYVQNKRVMLFSITLKILFSNRN